MGGAKKVFTCLNTKVCLRQLLDVTLKWLPFVGQKVAVFVGRTMRFFREKNSLKALYIINSEKVWNRSQTVGLVFHKLHRSHISTKYILKGIKACCAQAFATALAISSEISEEQCLKRIPYLVKNIMVLLRLGSDNSCPTIGLK